ncbi:hypothetical protein KKB40_05960 [Patescibacteria group bacterium]|nr:hypothetical protein [Patescibacteria group bacterium]
MERLKKETLITVFYVLYFGWLFTIAFLTQDSQLLNYFTGFVALFYLVLLKQHGDFWWFLAGILASVIIGTLSFSGFAPKLDLSLIEYTPYWLPLAWGTTFVALRKFYTIVTG